ncbi:MAG: hypothetical protein AB1898_04660 [Acidobacteriota bacterium]
MTDGGEGLEKRIWQKIIQQNMLRLGVDVSESECYILDPKRNQSVEIHFGNRKTMNPGGEPSETWSAVGRKGDSLETSSADYLILERSPRVRRFKQYIPWKNILQIAFPEATAEPPPPEGEDQP